MRRWVRRPFGAALVSLFLILGPAGQAAAARPAETAKVDAATSAGLVDLARSYLSQRTAALAAGADPSVASLGNQVASASESLLAQQRTAVAELRTSRDLLAEWGVAYPAGETVIRQHRLTVQGTVALLDVEEFTTLTYAKIKGDEPEYTAFAVDRQFTFALRPDGRWVLDGERRLNDGPAPVNEPTGAAPDAVRAALRAMPAVTTTSSPKVTRRTGPGVQDFTVQYDYGAMARYAETYWDNYNSAYRTFADVGGDCTNFISQAMRAGGWADDTGWYRSAENWWYNDLNETWSWVNVSYWHDFAAVHSGRTSILGSPSYMGLADVLQMDFTNDGSKDHTMIASYIGSEPYLTYHTNDTYRRSLAELTSKYPSARWLPHRT
jgi:hypothetical protein